MVIWTLGMNVTNDWGDNRKVDKSLSRIIEGWTGGPNAGARGCKSDICRLLQPSDTMPGVFVRRHSSFTDDWLHFYARQWSLTSARGTTTYLVELRIKDETLIIWPPSSPDLNPIENFWSTIKQDIYRNGRQFSSKENLWQAIGIAARAVPRGIIKKLTDSMNNRLFDLIAGHGRHVCK